MGRTRIKEDITTTRYSIGGLSPNSEYEIWVSAVNYRPGSAQRAGGHPHRRAGPASALEERAGAHAQCHHHDHPVGVSLGWNPMA